MRRVAIIAVGALAQGCFGFPPPGRPQSVPQIVDGEDMEYTSARFQDGVDVDGPTYSSTTTVMYRGRNLTQNEFAMMLSPEYVAKARRYDRLRSACLRGNIVKVVSVLTMIGGVVAWYSLDGRTDSTTRHVVGGGVLAGGAALYGLGYALGGNKCAAATDLGETIGASEFDSTNMFAAPAGQSDVDRFNALHGSKKKKAEETEPPASDESPAAPSAGE